MQGYASASHFVEWKVEGGKLQLSIPGKDLNMVLAQLEGKRGTFTLESEDAKAIRTKKQNNSLHKYFSLVSEALEAAGYDRKKVLSFAKMDLPPTPDFVKYDLWHPIQAALLGKTSTTELTKREDIDRVYEVLNRFLGEKLHIESIPFPSKESEEEELRNFQP